jgi:hypothetical protein
MPSYLNQDPTRPKYEGYHMLNQGTLSFIMDELHKRPYTSHPGYQKMITTTRKIFCWPVLKKDIDNYLDKCLECHQFKAKH